MKRKKNSAGARPYHYTFYLSAEEKEIMERNREQTLSPSLSHYMRSIVISQPMIQYIRIQSLDDILLEIARIQKHLDALSLYEHAAPHRPDEHQTHPQIVDLLSELNQQLIQILKICMHKSTP